MKSLLSVLTLLIAFTANAQQVSLHDIMQNTPAVNERIPGLRNFRVTLPGVLYRGGNTSGGKIPMDNVGLKSLAAKGFSASVYMYPYGWDKKPTNTQGIDYTNFGPDIRDRKSVHNFLSKVKDIIVNKKGPMYVHCWNGWHASGEMAAYALMQFCDMSPTQGTLYWNNNVATGRDTVKRIGKFVKFPDLEISAEEKSRICPR